MEQLARLAREVEKARSNRDLSAVSKKLQASTLLDSGDREVRRTAAELLRKINLSLSGLEPQAKGNHRETDRFGKRLTASIAVALAALFVCIAAGVFLLTRPHRSGVPVQVSVMPDRSTIELDGLTCITPDCHFVLKPGEHLVNVRKAGYKPKSVVVTVKDTDSTPLHVTAVLEPLPVLPVSAVPPDDPTAAPAALAKIQILGALPKTRVRLDGSDIGQVSEDGAFRVNVPPGPHTLDLSLDGFGKRTITRNFTRGEIVSLANEAVQLAPRQPNVPR
jgi:hypothetical protein